ncbi:hypothetical protein EGY05_08285 [Chryseobacterium arthrosphaerae]|uniref:hypothetical protein n=1 Tax=Chryseobacterium arthrosphaerae TaxID=651561 RepID=UPI000F4F37D3|nr:hypothetical protein [Chryseobacterium arthrosphaerae]AYZ11924.1 hypothetical protein EGY05_08285 [Chryseobacterium arthrosphaerae]
MKIFDFDVEKYGLQLVPPFLRDSIFIAYILAFLAPLVDLYQKFLDNREQNLIKLKFNYQVCSLEHRLNDAFDTLFRRIRIRKSVIYKGTFVYTESEIDPNNPDYYSDNYTNKMKWINGDEKPLYLRTESELNSVFDFIVSIPDSGINQIQMRAEIDFYVIQSKQYLIVIDNEI